MKLIYVAQRCGSTLVCLPKVETVLSQYLEIGVLICYCAEESDYASVNCVMFG